MTIFCVVWVYFGTLRQKPAFEYDRQCCSSWSEVTMCLFSWMLWLLDIQSRLLWLYKCVVSTNVGMEGQRRLRRQYRLAFV